MEYNEQKAIAYIRTKLPAESSQNYDDDEILNVIDMIFDYYEDNGLCDLDMSDDEPDELDVEDLMNYVKRLVAKDRESPLTIDDVETIVKAEIEYEDSLI